jgi:ApbE superfamily uncharacterized protein (UPF0280 family)
MNIVPGANFRMRAALLPGGRLHLQDGPIDLVIGADGEPRAIESAFVAATRRFETALDELCAELTLLREAMSGDAPLPDGAIARRMDRAVRPLAEDRFITRMAAVAGSVADEILACMVAAASLSRAYVNNGGDIALHLAPGATYTVGLIDRPDRPSLFGTARIVAADLVRGIATSGRGGRSFSFGIADAATVLARDAAEADAAATLVANAVDLPGHPAIIRHPACDFDPRSDLGDRLITRGVGPLSPAEVAQALDRGVAEAERLMDIGAIIAAAITLAGETRTAGMLALASPPRELMMANAG